MTVSLDKKECFILFQLLTFGICLALFSMCWSKACGVWTAGVIQSDVCATILDGGSRASGTALVQPVSSDRGH